VGELTPCNYCNHRHDRASAKRKGEIIVLKHDRGPLGGMNCYAVPKGEELDHEKHFVAWYMELTDRCMCD
jgi:hypothetical protein